MIEIFEWFHNNHLKYNTGKWNNNKLHFYSKNNTIVSWVNRVKFLGVHIDVRLNFHHHVSQICKKARK